MVKLSIVTLHTNDPSILQTLASVYKTVQTPFEYILVDNNRNAPRLQEIKEKYPKLKIIQNPTNYGYARGINVGLKQAQGDFILPLNPDILVFEKTIDTMVHYMEKHKDIALLGPKLLNKDKTIQYSCRRYPQLFPLILRRGPCKDLFADAYALYEMHDFSHKEIREVDWMCGGFLLMRKELLEKAGYLDEWFFLYFDDVDFCRRAHKYGKVIYYPEAEAIHDASYESKKKLIPFIIHTRSMLYYFLKHAFFPKWYLQKWSGWRKEHAK
jgi:hypothetical protein